MALPTTDRGSWTAFTAWTVLGVVGQAALCAITRAEPTVTYQHLRVPADPSVAWVEIGRAHV